MSGSVASIRPLPTFYSIEVVVNKYFANHWIDAVKQDRGWRSTVRNKLRLAYLDFHSLFSRPSGNFLRCVYLHYVFDEQLCGFEDILTRLKDFGEFVSTDTVLEVALGIREIDRRMFHLSFDDGFKNNLTNALPILKRQNVPALFFVPTSFIGAEYTAVRDYCVNTAGYLNPVEMMNWSDVKKICDSGFEVGSHTRTHKRLYGLSPESLYFEIYESKRDIEKNIGGECKYISWPFGLRSDIDELAFSEIRSAGYRGCFSACRGEVTCGKTDALSIPRHHFEPHWPANHVICFANGFWEH